MPGLLAELHDKGFKVVHMVAKAPVATIASYDAAAEKAIAAKTASKSADPMAQRSLVWTMTPPPSTKHKVWKHTKKVQAKPSIVEGLPAASTTPAKAQSSGKTKDENQPWQLNFFN